MGYVFAMGACICCGRVFTFNPHTVPSIRIVDTREPVCKSCIEVVNQARVRHGMQPHSIPDDAYEALPEEEL